MLRLGLNVLLLASLTSVSTTALGGDKDCWDQGEAQPCYVTDVAVTVDLPSGWKTSLWSDWEFKARAKDKTVMMDLFYTDYQVVVDDAAVSAWAAVHGDRLTDLDGTEIETARTAVSTVNGLETGHVELTYTFAGSRAQGVWFARIFPVSGKMLHVATIAQRGNSAKARRALDQIIAGLELGHPAQPTDDLAGVVKAQPGFEADLPPGWRQPLPAEMSMVRHLAAKTGQSKIDGEKCWVAVRPVAVGEPDLMLFCKAHWFLDPIDEHSWAGVEQQVHARFFGKSPKPVQTAEQINVGDRVGFLYSPQAAERAIRVAVASFDQGIVVGWGLAQVARTQELDGAIRQTLADTRFTGPEGGAPIHGGVHWIHYYATYRNTDPVVVGPLLFLVVLLGLGLKRLLKRAPTAPDDGFISEEP
jgi:hypothetical protein